MTTSFKRRDIVRRDIVVITNDDSLIMPSYLDGTLDFIANRISLVAISPLHPPKQFIKTLRKCLQSYGPCFLFSTALRTLHQKGKSIFVREASVKGVCRKHGISVEYVEDINAQEFVSTIQELKPRILLMLACGQVARNQLISAVSGNILNVHSALLPKYRGLNAPFWALRNGETETGISVHLVNDEKIDAGDIVLQERVPIMSQDTYFSLARRISRIGPQVVARAIDSICSENFIPQPNDLSQGFYRSWPTKEDVRAFREQGRRFF